LHLTGEALFIVAPDSSRPFRVFTHDLSVTALGTTFNVRAVDGESESKVVLTEGKVRVDAATATDVLNPGEEIVFKTKERRLAAKRKIAAPAPKAEIKSALQSGSWVYFNQTPFADVVTSLEYNFNVRFVGIYPALRDQPVSYSFRGGQSLQTILRDLSIRCHFTYKVCGNEILIEEEHTTFDGPGE
jgi:transmembrane sensor